MPLVFLFCAALSNAACELRVYLGAGWALNALSPSPAYTRMAEWAGTRLGETLQHTLSPPISPSAAPLVFIGHTLLDEGPPGNLGWSGDRGGLSWRQEASREWREEGGPYLRENNL